MDKGLLAGRQHDVGEKPLVAADQRGRDEGRGKLHGALLPPGRGGHRRPSAAVMIKTPTRSVGFRRRDSGEPGWGRPTRQPSAGDLPSGGYSRGNLAGELVLDVGAHDVLE